LLTNTDEHMKLVLVCYFQLLCYFSYLTEIKATVSVVCVWYCVLRACRNVGKNTCSEV